MREDVRPNQTDPAQSGVYDTFSSSQGVVRDDVTIA